MSAAAMEPDALAVLHGLVVSHMQQTGVRPSSLRIGEGFLDALATQVVLSGIPRPGGKGNFSYRDVIDSARKGELALFGVPVEVWSVH